MKVGGFQKFSLVDFPGKTAAVIFTLGCNFRCPYCHNPELVLNRLFTGDRYTFESVLDFLQTRAGLLDAVVVTGGEPTLHADLHECLGRIQALGFPVKLDTNGSRPEVLRRLISEKRVDFIAMDIKAPLEKYSQVCGVACEPEKIMESIQRIRFSGIPHLFRTTWDQTLLDENDLSAIRQITGGCDSVIVQPCIRHQGKPWLRDVIQPGENRKVLVN